MRVIHHQIRSGERSLHFGHRPLVFLRPLFVGNRLIVIDTRFTGQTAGNPADALHFVSTIFRFHNVHLGDHSIFIPGIGIAAKTEVAQTIENIAAAVLLHFLEHMGVRTTHHIRTGINGCLPRRNLSLHRFIGSFKSPMRAGNDHIRALLFQRCHTGLHILRSRAKGGYIDAQFHSLDLVNFPISAGKMRHPYRIQCSLGILNPGFAKLVGVVIAHRCQIHTALRQNLSIGRRGAEIEGGRGSQLVVRETALQVCDGEIILSHNVHHAGKRPGVIIPYDALKIIIILTGGQCAVPHHGDHDPLFSLFRFFCRRWFWFRGIQSVVGNIRCFRHHFLFLFLPTCRHRHQHTYRQ